MIHKVIISSYIGTGDDTFLSYVNVEGEKNQLIEWGPHKLATKTSKLLAKILIETVFRNRKVYSSFYFNERGITINFAVYFKFVATFEETEKNGVACWALVLFCSMTTFTRILLHEHKALGVIWAKPWFYTALILLLVINTFFLKWETPEVTAVLKQRGVEEHFNVWLISQTAKICNEGIEKLDHLYDKYINAAVNYFGKIVKTLIYV